ncbi:unnamed protein product [Rotaria sordida]|uniref:Uncharacterized protein n=1 Tax=Rotaria sordida TaxID=392033 RepID=A0A815IPQ8_9BILA|nr:unnamed protein product [Rotaria sordida]CAF3698147.1 unnamed protein product [Rotaria sordida]
MNAKNRLNLLLSDILRNESSSNNEFSQGSSTQILPSLTFSEHDYHPSSMLSSVMRTTSSSSSIAPLPPRRNSSSLRHIHQNHHIHQSDLQKQQQQQQQQQPQPLLNSSTLDDIFRALTLECEQYLAASSTSSYQNKTYEKLIIQPSKTTMQKNVDSNDDDYENLHSSKLPLSNGLSSLKTRIEVMSPEKRQVVSISVSSKLSSSPIVSCSQTYPLLSNSCTTTSILPPINCHSSDEDSIDISSSSTNRKRRRRIRKQHIISSTNRSNSSSDEQTDTINGIINEKKSIISKRSYSTDHRQQRIKSIYDNHPISISAQKFPTRRTRRRDISLQQQQQQQQQHLPIPTKYNEDNPSNFYSPLSVLLTSTRSTNDFVDRSQQQQQQQRRSRFELVNHQPVTLLDRMHHQFYRASSTHNNNNNNNIPTHRIPSYPVY